MSNKNRFKFKNIIFHFSNCIVFAVRMKFKIFKRIISFIPIFMMNMFPSFKRTIKRFRHYKTMFIDFASFVSHWMMLPKKYFYISMISRFSLKRTISILFFPCKKTIAILTNTSKNASFQSFQNYVFPPCTNIATFTTRYINHKPFCPIWINFLKFVFPMNYRFRFKNLIFQNCFLFHNMNYTILKGTIQEEV